MASFDKALTDFIQKFGEEAVPTALNLYVSQRERGKAYAEKRKVEVARSKAILRAAEDPKVAARLKELGITI